MKPVVLLRKEDSVYKSQFMELTKEEQTRLGSFLAKSEENIHVIPKDAFEVLKSHLVASKVTPHIEVDSLSSWEPK